MRERVGPADDILVLKLRQRRMVRKHLWVLTELGRQVLVLLMLMLRELMWRLVVWRLV